MEPSALGFNFPASDPQQSSVAVPNPHAVPCCAMLGVESVRCTLLARLLRLSRVPILREIWEAFMIRGASYFFMGAGSCIDQVHVHFSLNKPSVLLLSYPAPSGTEIVVA